MIAGATCVDDVVSVGLSFKCIPLTQHSWYSTPGFNWQAKKKKTRMHCQKKHTRSSSWDQTACRALGSKGAERRDTWPAVNKEHPLWTTQQPGETHRQTHTYKCLHTKIHSHTRTYHTQRYNIYLPSEKMHILYSDRCAYNTTDTLYHASFTRYADKQTADSHNGCYRKSRPYSSSLSLWGK